MNDIESIVIDNGSGIIKAGFAGENAPRIELPSIHGMHDSQKSKDYYIGTSAYDHRGILQVRYPIINGKIKNIDDMTHIYKYLYYGLYRSPEDHPVLITDAKFSKSNKKQLAQILFETFHIPSFTIENQNILALYSAGLTTGVSCVFGEGVSSALSMYNGEIRHFSCSDIGGRTLTNYLERLLWYNPSFDSARRSVKKEMARDIIEQIGKIAFDYDNIRDTNCYELYRMPDQTIFMIGKERFMCPELLFRPEMNGLDIPGIHNMIYDTIMHSDRNIQTNLFQRIVVSGGLSMINGFRRRIKKEITNLAPANTNIVIRASPEPKYNTWIGGSILGSLSTFPEMLIDRNQYNENGENIVQRNDLKPESMQNYLIR